MYTDRETIFGSNLILRWRLPLCGAHAGVFGWLFQPAYLRAYKHSILFFSLKKSAKQISTSSFTTSRTLPWSVLRPRTWRRRPPPVPVRVAPTTGPVPRPAGPRQPGTRLMRTQPPFWLCSMVVSVLCAFTRQLHGFLPRLQARPPT